jgi:hypothetical protein
MSELKFFFINGGLNSILLIVDLVKFLEKNQKLHFDCSSHIEGDIVQNHEQNKKVEKSKNQDSMGKTNFFLSTLPFNPWAISATWMHVGAPQKI